MRILLLQQVASVEVNSFLTLLEAKAMTNTFQNKIKIKIHSTPHKIITLLKEHEH